MLSADGVDLQVLDLARDAAATLIERARRICPFSKATLGNVEIAFTMSEPGLPAVLHSVNEPLGV